MGGDMLSLKQQEGWKGKALLHPQDRKSDLDLGELPSWSDQERSYTHLLPQCEFSSLPKQNKSCV